MHSGNSNPWYRLKIFRDDYLIYIELLFLVDVNLPGLNRTAFSILMLKCCFLNLPLIKLQKTSHTQKFWLREFPGGPVVRTGHIHCHGPGSVSGWGTKPHSAVKNNNNFFLFVFFFCRVGLLYLHVLCLWIQPTMNRKYLWKKIPESSKKQNLNLLCSGNYLLRIYFV